MPNYFRIPTSLGMVVAIAVAAGNPPAAHADPTLASPTSQTASVGNAAPLYRQAVENFDPDEPDADASIDAAVEKFLALQKPRLDLLRRAAAMPRCDWGKPFELGETEPLGKLRQLANIGILQSRYDLAQHRPADAVDDLLAVMSLGRHVGRTPLLISELVEVGIVNSSMEQFARIMPQLPHDVAVKLPGRLDALPRSSGLGATLLGEYAYALEIARHRKPDEVGWDEATIVSAKPFYEAMARAATLPPEPFAQRVFAELSKLPPGAGRTFAATIVPAIEPIRVPTATSEARFAMLRAAADVVARGPEAVKQSHDPFGDGPFGYRAIPSGFELTSKLTTRGEAVKLTVGRSDGAGT